MFSYFWFRIFNDHLLQNSDFTAFFPFWVIFFTPIAYFFPRCRLYFFVLLRMGSFTSSPALVAEDNQDDALSFQPGAHEELVERCRKELMELPTPLERRFRNYSLQSTQSTQGD